MFETLPALPATSQEFGAWTWEQIAPYYAELESRPLNAEAVDTWLLDWTTLAALMDELNTWYSIATTVNTADTATQDRYTNFLDNIQPKAAAAEQRLGRACSDVGATNLLSNNFNYIHVRSLTGTHPPTPAKSDSFTRSSRPSSPPWNCLLSHANDFPLA